MLHRRRLSARLQIDVGGAQKCRQVVRTLPTQKRNPRISRDQRFTFLANIILQYTRNHQSKVRVLHLGQRTKGPRQFLEAVLLAGLHDQDLVLANPQPLAHRLAMPCQRLVTRDLPAQWIKLQPVPGDSVNLVREVHHRQRYAQ